MGCNQQYSLTWGEFGSCLSSTAQLLREERDLVDVTLAAGGKIFPAHRLVLSAASPLLKDLLKTAECQHPVILLAGVAPDDLELILQFIYQGEVSVDPDQLPSLLQAARCLDIQALSSSSESEKFSCSVDEECLSRAVMAPSMIQVRKKKRKTISESGDNSDDTKSNPDASSKENYKRNLLSDLPVSCGICGVTLRQSRNLRRHMELIHLKSENGEGSGRRKRHKRSENACESLPDVPPDYRFYDKNMSYFLQESYRSSLSLNRLFENTLGRGQGNSSDSSGSQGVVGNLYPNYDPPAFPQHVMPSSSAAQYPVLRPSDSLFVESREHSQAPSTSQA